MRPDLLGQDRTANQELWPLNAKCFEYRGFCFTPLDGANRNHYDASSTGYFATSLVNLSSASLPSSRPSLVARRNVSALTRSASSRGSIQPIVNDCSGVPAGPAVAIFPTEARHFSVDRNRL